MAVRPAYSKRISIDNSTLEYDAEKAYILATTAAASTATGRTSRTSAEFEFSLTQSQLQSAFRAAKEAGNEEAILSTLGEEGEEKGRGGSLTRRDVEEEDGTGETVKPKPLPKLSIPDKDQRILVVYGPRGCGKSHFFRKLVHSNRSVFSPVVSHTTRQRRETEIKGIDFHFISREEMTTQIARGDFIEYVQISSNKKDHHGKKKRRRRNGKGEKATEPVEGIRDDLLDSVFDLKEEDRPSRGGELFGTSRQALEESQLQKKPCVILNVSPSGARQLKESGLQATFVLLYPEGDAAEHSGIQPDYAISIGSFDRAFSELQQFAFGLVQDMDTIPGTTRDAMEDEWRIIPTWNIGPEGTTNDREITQKPQRTVTFNELLVHFQAADLSTQMASLHRGKEESGREKGSSFSHLFRGSAGKHKLSKKLKHERNLVFAIAQCPLNDQEKIHLQALQSIYRQLTGSPSPGRYGSHWEDVGFNGVDPADDLRGVGFLGLMQLVNLLENPRTLPLAQELYRQSRSTDKEHSIPFCVLSLNLTQVALSSLREGYLSKLCNKRDQVFVVVNDYHIAMLYHYFHIWKTQSKTIKDVGTLVQEVAHYAQRNTKALLRGVEAHLDTGWNPSPTAEYVHRQSSDNPFTSLDQLQQLADTTTVV